MDIAKFIEENFYADLDGQFDGQPVILVDDLKELLKTHTLVPNEPVKGVCINEMGFPALVAAGHESIDGRTPLYASTPVNHKISDNS